MRWKANSNRDFFCSAGARDRVIAVANEGDKKELHKVIGCTTWEAAGKSCGAVQNCTSASCRNEQKPKNRKSKTKKATPTQPTKAASGKLHIWVQRPSISVHERLQSTSTRKWNSTEKTNNVKPTKLWCLAKTHTRSLRIKSEKKARGSKARNSACTDGGSMGFGPQLFCIFFKPCLKFGSRSRFHATVFLFWWWASTKKRICNRDQFFPRGEQGSAPWQWSQSPMKPGHEHKGRNPLLKAHGGQVAAMDKWCSKH